MDSIKISVSLFVVVAISFCLVGEISSQDVSENLLYVMFYSNSHLIGQPLGMGPACYELTIQGQAACESIAGCMWTENASCRSVPSDSPATVTMQGDCSGNKALTKQCIAGYNADYDRWLCLNKCLPKRIGESMNFSCKETDGRVMTWDVDACTISVDLIANQTELQAQDQRIPFLNFLFDAIEKGDAAVFMLLIAASFAAGLYLSEIISKPKKSWKRYVKKNHKKAIKSSGKKSRKR